MKRIFRLLAASMAAAVLLTGCGAAAPAQSEASSAKEAVFTPSLDTSATASIEVRGSWQNFEALEAAAADWNEIYPNVSINYVKVDDYNKHLNELLLAADKPDIVVYNTSTYYESKDSVEDHLADLSPIVDTSIYSDGTLALAKRGDKLLTVNWGMQAPGFLVNETLLESLGLSIPATHEELLTTCAALKEAGYVPIQGCYINVYSYFLRNDRNLRIAQEPDQDALYQQFSTGAKGCGAYFDPEYETLFSMLENGYLDHSTNLAVEDIYEKSILSFFEGNAPFFCVNAETVSGMKKRESKSEAFTAHPFDYTFVSLPVENETPALSVSALDGLALVSGSANQEWGAEFLRFLCCDKELNTMAQVKGVPTLTGSGNTDKRFTSIDSIPAEDRINEGEYPVIALITAPYDDTMWDIAEGRVTTVEQAEAAFEEKLQAVLANR